MINIYIDTDLKGVKGKANYGYYLEWERPGKDIKTRGGFGVAEDTRNRIFLRAAAEALERITKPEEIHIYAPCPYMTESATKKLPMQWCLHGWIRGEKAEVKNKDLWERMLPKLREFNIQWHDGKHAYSEEILREIRRMQDGTMGNGDNPGRGGQSWTNGASPYHF